MKKIVLAALALAATSGLAAAQGYRTPDRIDQRQANQEKRIQQGVRTGSITRQEYRKLETEQAHIRALERSAKRDGHVDRREAARIAAAQNAADRHIYQEKHDANARHRYGFWRKPGLWHRRWW